MVKLDPLTQAEDDKVLAEFLLDPGAGFVKGNKTIFSKVASIPKSVIHKIHNRWDIPNDEKSSIIRWHRQNTENTNKDFIYAIVESFKVGLFDDTIEALTRAKDEGYGLSVENLYTALEMAIGKKLPMEWAVEMAVEKTSDEVAEEMEEEQKREEAKHRKLQENKITLEKLQEKWNG